MAKRIRQAAHAGASARRRYAGGMLPIAVPRVRIAACFALFLATAFLAARTAGAFDLFAAHEVTAQFATADGKPMANAEVRVFAPGQPKTPVETGRTDAAGKFVFDADRDGLWSAEAQTASEVARVTIRVGGHVERRSWLGRAVLLVALAVLLVVLFWYRLRRIGPRSPKP